MPAERACDVAIVGAGVMGCALASELSRSGVGTAVLERGPICSGSSGRNGGGVRHQFSGETNVRLATRTVRRILSFEEEFGLNVAFQQVGYLFMASTEAYAAALRASVAAQNALGVPTRFIPPEEIAGMVPGIYTGDLLGGAYCHLDGHLNPRVLVEGFAADARRNGAQFRENTEVVGFETAGERVGALRLSDGTTLRAGTVVNCAGAWAGAVASLYGGGLPISPWRSQVFVIEDLPDLGERFPMTIDYENGKSWFHRGLDPSLDSLVAGIDNESSSELDWDVACDWSKSLELVARLTHRVPALEGARVADGWAGFLELTPDENPVVGWTHHENLYTAAGFSGHGLSLAPALAEEVARELTGSRSTIPLDPYRPERFEADQLEVEEFSMR